MGWTILSDQLIQLNNKIVEWTILGDRLLCR